MFNVLVTGASGFVASALVDFISQHSKYKIHRLSRQLVNSSAKINSVQVDDLAVSDFSKLLSGIHCIVHTAARVHVMNDAALDPLAEYRRVNVDGTLNLARQAATAGVNRFIFLSSIKVNGESTTPGMAYRADDAVIPLDAYGISKHEAEQGLLALAAETGIEVVIIRPVLVYGPGVKANFLSMMRWLSKGIPLPFGTIHNKRSLVSLDNLVDFIVTCMDHPAAANQVFLVSDGEDLSTTDLLRRMAKALGKPARLLPVPVWILELAARLIGKQDLAQRLCGSLQVDISKPRKLLDWTPPVSVDDGLRKTAEYFLEHQAK